MMLYLLLKHAHTGIRWIALALLIAAIINSIIKAGNKYSSKDKKLNSLTIYSLHFQIVIGVILYFLSPKVIFSAESMSNRILRFFLVEHISMMIIAVVIATIGYSYSKRARIDSNKHLRISIFYTIAILLILYAIPWPWQNYASGWF
jgi:uncharacterized protein YacL